MHPRDSIPNAERVNTRTNDSGSNVNLEHERSLECGVWIVDELVSGHWVGTCTYLTLYGVDTVDS